MAIQRYSTYEEVGHPERDGQWIRYADHEADCREREKTAFMAGAAWADGDMAGTIDNAALVAEADRRYGEGRGK